MLLPNYSEREPIPMDESPPKKKKERLPLSFSSWDDYHRNIKNLERKRTAEQNQPCEAHENDEIVLHDTPSGSYFADQA